MSISAEWAELRRLLHVYVKAGGTLRALGRRTGVAQPTLSSWLINKEPPETVAKAGVVMDELMTMEIRCQHQEP